MAFRASNKTPSVQYERLKNTCTNLRTFSDNKVAKYNSVGLDANELENLFVSLSEYKDSIAGFASTSGMSQYAKDQETDQNYDVVAEFNALSAAINDVVSFIETAWPKDSNGYLLTHKIVDGEIVPREITGAAVATLISKIEVVRDSII